MMKLLKFLIGSLVVFGAQVEMKAGKAKTTIVSFGDSTTAPRGKLRVYSEIIESALIQRGIAVDVINAGVGGNTTAMAHTRFQSDVLQHSPDVVIVQFGINDSAVDVWKTPPATVSRVSLAVYEENLRFFLQQIRAAGAEPILMTPNPIGWTEKLKSLYGQPPYDPEEVEGFNVMLKHYAAKARTIARDEEVSLIDIYGKMEGEVDRWTLDGMHPNAAGHQLVADALLPALLQVLKRRQDSLSQE